jgi:hypothetical protein
MGCALALIVVTASGCGGGSGSSLYTLSATQGCLKKAGYTAAPLPNSLLTGSRGNLRVRLSNAEPILTPNAPPGSVVPHEWVFLVFQDSHAAALQTEQKAVALTIRSLNAEGEVVTPAFIERGVGLAENVFYYSPTGPLTRGERARVDACLR